MQDGLSLITFNRISVVQMAGSFHKRILAVIKNRYFILQLLFVICSMFYYFGELAKYFGWVRLEWNFFYVVHDIHRLLFLCPIIFAALFCGPIATILVSLGTLLVFLPRALLFSPYPDPIARAVIFAVVEGIIGMLFLMINHKPKWLLNKSQQNQNVVELMSKFPDAKDSAFEVFSIRNLNFNLSTRTVKRQGYVIKLTRTEYKLLIFLVQNRGKVLSHQEILKNVWGSEYGNESEYLRTFIRQIRKKIEDDPTNPQIILTQQGSGYRCAER